MYYQWICISGIVFSWKYIMDGSHFYCCIMCISKVSSGCQYKGFFLIICNSLYRWFGNPEKMHEHASFTTAIKANLILGLAVHLQLTMMKGLAFGGKEFNYHYLVKMFAFCRFCKKKWQVWSRDLWVCAPGMSTHVSSCPVTQHTSCSMWTREKFCLEFDYTR